MRWMSDVQTWDPATYARHARFVSDLGSPVVELLAPRPGERILDLGCGDGVLTKQLADLGCEVVAVDSSAPQIEAARKLGLNAQVMDAEALPFSDEFDAVFSNAVLHWIRNTDPFSVRCTWSLAEISWAVPPMRATQPSALHRASDAEMNSAPSGTSFARITAS